MIFVQVKQIPAQELIPLLLSQIEDGGQAKLPVTGHSMLPMLRPGRDSVLLTKAGELKKGDIPLFQRDNGRYVIHRIVKSKNGRYICCGDHQHEPEAVRPDQVLAVVVGFTRKGKAHTCAGHGYRLYTWLWTHTFFMRRPILAVYGFFGKCKRKLRRG